MQAYCRNFFFALLATLIVNICSAGVIKGKVTDAFTGEPLVGATVKLANTKFKTIVKLDGTFNFPNVPKGVYSIEIVYAGYTIKPQSITLVTDEEVKSVSFKVESSTAEIESVTVSTKTHKGDDIGARRIEKIADPILNVLSAKTIQLLPDITVANALQRVSGVTIERSNSGEGRYPIIRGMEKRYINTLINGIKIPSPDNKNRFIPLDLFPSELLERLEVSKSLTPSMEGDAIGGTINLVMKDAPNKFLFQANGSLGYNTTFLTDRYNKFSTVAINKLSPAEIMGSSYKATFRDFNVNHLNYSNVNAPVSNTLGLSIGDRFGKNKKFGFILSGSYQSIYKGITSNFFLPASQPGLYNIPLFSDLQLRKYSTQSKRLGLTGKLDYKINAHNKLSLTTTFVRLDDYQTRMVWDTVALNSLVDNWQRSTWQYQSIYNNTLQGIHHLTPTTTFDWSLVYSIANNHIPDQAQFIHEYPIVATSLSGDKLQKMSRIWSHNSDQDYAAYANMTKRLNSVFDLKFGTLIRSKTRDNLYHSYTLTPLSGELYTNINNAIYNDPPNPGQPVVSGNNYTFRENISAFYIQGRWQVAKALEALGGFRYENTYQHYETQLLPAVAAREGTIKYGDLLPSMQLKYALTKNETLRFSYYRALARPGFAEMIPDGPDGEFFKEQGNPAMLNHSVADNLDLRYEYYSKAADQVLLGVFYKNIQDPIEISTVKPAPNVNSLYLMPTNSPKATNYGFEAVVTKYFGAFGVSANYTYTQSRISKDSLLYSDRGQTGGSVLTYKSETRPLQGQSNHTGNLSLMYKNPKIGLDIQAALVYTGERIVFISPYYGLNYWQSPLTQLDLSFEKRVIKGLTVFGKINNLTNAPYELSLHQSYNKYLTSSGSRPLALQTDPDNRIIVQKDYYKISYLFGLRYKL
ncbi:MAG: TonB-dependent receptor [Sphingobacteriia bacterium]|nr:TonB-dependent receptor [Sphingobacteriia bacterium]